MEMSEDVLVDETPEGDHQVQVRLKAPIPKEGWKSVQTYLTGYVLASGWRLDKLKRTNYALSFRVSKA